MTKQEQSAITVASCILLAVVILFLVAMACTAK
jgi:hypothetical protein